MSLVCKDLFLGQFCFCPPFLLPSILILPGFKASRHLLTLNISSPAQSGHQYRSVTPWGSLSSSHQQVERGFNTSCGCNHIYHPLEPMYFPLKTTVFFVKMIQNCSKNSSNAKRYKEGEKSPQTSSPRIKYHWHYVNTFSAIFL